MRLIIADRTGWTLDYVDSLMLNDVLDLLAYWEGRAKAESTQRGGAAI